ncbi:MAG: efflux RND transporter periplasmic adaptor subunit [Acidobacteria bacterium]|nr:MAG: efflux RND transporter periplasmic adaptor subunit [Acidobacteriota bacterium]
MRRAERRTQNAERRMKKWGGRDFYVLRSAFCVLRSSALAILVLGSLACAEKTEKPRDETVPVTVAQVVKKNVPLEIEAIGNVQPLSTVEIRALAGGQLMRVWFKEGDDVARGQMLFTIDPRPYQATLQQAQANLARDEALLRNAESQQARYDDLVKKDYVTKEEYSRIVSAAEAARAVAAADRAAAENARLQLSYCEIRSPITGRTGGLKVYAGNLVKANDTTPLVVINQIEPVRVQFSIPQDQLATIHTSVTTNTEVHAGQARGTLSFIDNAVDPRTGTIALKATFPNRDRSLWPGQFVTVAMKVAERDDAIVVPARAVQVGQKGQYVYVVNGNAVEMRPIAVFRTIGQDTIVDKGLAVGEVVVTDGQLRLTPKSKIEIKG